MTKALVTESDFSRLRRLAEVLIPGTKDMPAIDELAEFDGLLETAIRACGYTADDITLSLGAIPEPIDWESAREFSLSHPSAFAIASTLASAAYFMAPQVLQKLNFPVARQHPAEVEEFVEEYETGILDAVTSRGALFRDPDGTWSQ